MNKEIKKQNTDSLRNNVLKRIDRDEITPLSRTLYIGRNILFWTLWGLSILLGAIAVSILIFTELNVGWEFYEMTHQNALTFFVASLPYIWIALLTLVVVLGIYNLRKTKNGYRHSLAFIILLGFGGSVLGGFLLHANGLGEHFEMTIGKRVPLHIPFEHMRESFLTQPERGMYAGVIEILDGEGHQITIRTPQGKKVSFTTQFVPQHLLINLGPNRHIRIIATSSKFYDTIVACHLSLFEEGNIQSLEDIRERRGRMQDVLNNFLGESDGLMNEISENPCRGLLLPQKRGH